MLRIYWKHFKLKKLTIYTYMYLNFHPYAEKDWQSIIIISFHTFNNSIFRLYIFLRWVDISLLAAWYVRFF